MANAGECGGSGTYPGNSNWSSVGTSDWEVWNDRRGEAARGLFYMNVRYAGGTHPVTANPEPDLILTDDEALIRTRSDGIGYMGLLTPLLQWNAQDPPDDRELRRMEIVGHPQGNRNPFVDYPRWADRIFAGDCSQVAPIHPQQPTAMAGAGDITISWQPRIESDLAGYNVYRSTTSGGPYTQINLSIIATTSYIDSSVLDGTTYYYVVRTVDNEANQSGDSAQVFATPGARAQFYQESFVTPGTGYFVSPAFAEQTTFKYFDRYTIATKPAGMSSALTGVDGTWFIGGQNTDADSIGPLASGRWNSHSDARPTRCDQLYRP